MSQVTVRVPVLYTSMQMDLLMDEVMFSSELKQYDDELISGSV